MGAGTSANGYFVAPGGADTYNVNAAGAATNLVVSSFTYGPGQAVSAFFVGTGTGASPHAVLFCDDGAAPTNHLARCQ
jgi:hypothetical protein